MSPMRWAELSRVGKVIGACLGIAAAGALIFGTARLLRPPVIDMGTCGSRVEAKRLTGTPGDVWNLAVPLAFARAEPVRIAHVRPLGSARGNLTISAAPTRTLGSLPAGPRHELPATAKTQPVDTVVVKSIPPETKKGDPAIDRLAWSLVVRASMADAGIYNLAGLDVTYTNGKRTSTCSHDLAIPILIGPLSDDSSRQPPVYEGARYGALLTTHCGIRATDFGGLQWVMDPPITEVPSGWAEPFQEGTMRLEDPATALFETKNGRKVRFRPRRAGDPAVQGCD